MNDTIDAYLDRLLMQIEVARQISADENHTDPIIKGDLNKTLIDIETNRIKIINKNKQE